MKWVRDHTVQILVGVIAALTAGYILLLARNAIAAATSGNAVGLGLGIAMLVVVGIGVWVVWSSLSAGFAHQRLARRAHEEGIEVDVSDLPRMPSGRVRRDAADTLFDGIRREWEADPGNWRTNYRVARAYDHAGDRSRARESMRRAVELERAERRRSGDAAAGE